MSINRGRHENYNYSVTEAMGYDLVVSLAIHNQNQYSTGKGWFPRTHAAHDKLISWCYIRPLGESTSTGVEKFTFTRLGAGLAWAFAAEQKFRERVQVGMRNWPYFPLAVK